MVGTKPKRKADPVSSGPVSVWALLQVELSTTRERPENSITAEELAHKTGYSFSHAGNLLRNNPKLKPVRYLVPESRRVGTCYVPNDEPPEAA
jgi:hypothetical protein